MNTHVVFFGRRFNMVSRASRRLIVALINAGFALWIIGWSSGSQAFGLISMLVAFASLLVLASLAGTGYEGGDEREVHRRDHIFFVVHRRLSIALPLLLITAAFHGSNPVTALVSPAIQAVLERLSYAVLFAFVALYATLPQTLILWTEPDMEEPQ